MAHVPGDLDLDFDSFSSILTVKAFASDRLPFLLFPSPFLSI
jgi:hypothetical protein